MVGATRAALEAGELNWMTLTPPESLAINIAAHEELRRAGKVTAFEKQYPAPGRLAGVGADEPGEAAGHRR